MIYVATAKSFGYMGRLWDIGDKTPDVIEAPPAAVFAPDGGFEQIVPETEEAATFHEINKQANKSFKDVFVEKTTEEPKAQVDYQAMTVKGLKEVASDLGITLQEGLKKAQIIEILESKGNATVELD